MGLQQPTIVVRHVIIVVLILCASARTSSGKQCKVSCNRLENNVTYGFDANRKEVTVDIGKCQETYNDLAGCETVGSTNDSECFRRCEPRSYLTISTSNRSGPLVVNAIKTCYATRHHCIDCQRKPSIVYVFPVSKYQTRVDVGKCVGKCANGSENGCMPVKEKTVAVEGPNGPTIMSTIEQCSCESSACYRADFFESYSELVISGNTTRREEKAVNVGKCTGRCSGVLLPGRCYPDYYTMARRSEVKQRSGSEDKCLLYLEPKTAKCVPTVGGETTFTDIHGVLRTVSIVTECGCSTG